MNKVEGLTEQLQEGQQLTAAFPPANKRPWQEPELTYVQPKLTKVGPLKEVTGEFFDSFTPPSSADDPDPPPE
ncbi:MAG: hypothetical protein GY856_04465 [bacterium]|nr:hypothetical protein [bacterium]